MRPQTFPIPAIKLPHGVDSSFSKPVNAPSSRNGESWSSKSATRSLANFTSTAFLDETAHELT